MSMRISNVSLLNKTMGNSRVSSNDAEDFQKSMTQKRADGDISQKLLNLLERIDVQAEKLAKRLSMQDLIEYKRLVGQFIDIAVNSSYKYKKQSFLDRRGRHRILNIVKMINDEIDALTREIYKNEKDRLDILAKIDDIRGMLLDIMM